MRYLLGIDDTDSRFGHCTTHLGYLIACELARFGCTFPTYPRLVRLNPNIPFKTRGNAAVCIEFEARSSNEGDQAFEAAERLLEAEADVKNGANSALLMVSEADDLPFFRQTYLQAVSGVVGYKRIIREISKMGVRHRLLGNGMGVVGAAASIGFSCSSDDHTYELIAYRRPQACGTPRAVEPRSVRKMEVETFPRTFNSYDHESGRVLLAPTGPDPVLVGLQGRLSPHRHRGLPQYRGGGGAAGPRHLRDEPVHRRPPEGPAVEPLKAFSAGWLEGVVASVRPSQGGHTLLQLGGDPGLRRDVHGLRAVGDLRHVVRLLMPGDEVRVSGGVRRASSKNPIVINVEKIDVLSVSKPRANPRCTSCGSRMKSEGRGKGYQCRMCGRKTAEPARDGGPSRRIEKGTYLPSPRAQRHLTKQLIRYGMEQTGARPLVDGWLEPQGHVSVDAESLFSASEATASISAE